jgi:hypothetical protein
MMAKLGACLALVLGTMAMTALAAPLLVGPRDLATLAETSVPEALAAGCATALVLAWAWLLLGTAVCLVDEIGRARTDRPGADRPDASATGARGTLLRPRVARRLAAGLVGGGLTCLVVTPAPATHAAPAELPLPTLPLGAAVTSEGPAPGPRTVVVRAGDSLWSLAASRLPSSAPEAAVDAAWRRLYEHNRTTVGPDPDLIHPGDRLRLP